MFHTLGPKTANKAKKRVGRGGKRGTTSGKGQKGQRSRSGHRIRPAERDILSKFPKFRGTRNTKRSQKSFEIGLNDLHKFADAKGVLTKRMLITKNHIGKLSDVAKILSNGEVTKAFTIEGISVSAAARKKIEAKGGTIK